MTFRAGFIPTLLTLLSVMSWYVAGVFSHSIWKDYYLLQCSHDAVTEDAAAMVAAGLREDATGTGHRGRMDPGGGRDHPRWLHGHKAELPGMKRQDVVAFKDGFLTISAERKEEEERKGENYLVKERRYGSFSRSMTLPEGVDESKIKANFKEGLLEVIVEGAGATVEERPKQIEGG